MAYTKKTTATKTSTKPVVTEEVVSEPVVEKVEVKNKKFDADEVIECLSITPGELFYVGGKTKDLYTFADMGDVVEIPFKDLDYSARSRDALMYKPRFIVQSADFVALHPNLDAVYSALHSKKDLRDILKLPAEEMKSAILSLPSGAQEAIKTIAATMVDNGELDSIKRVQAIDDIFSTNMMLKISK